MKDKAKLLTKKRHMKRTIKKSHSNDLFLNIKNKYLLKINIGNIPSFVCKNR